MVGAIVPDLDLLYFYLVDARQTHHHHYFSHWPALWLALALLSGLCLRFHRSSHWAQISLAFAHGGVLHMLLDSLVGDIWWLAPLHDQPYALFSVPARYQPWWLSFMLHWSFLVELLICLIALRLYRQRHLPNLKQPP